MIISALLKEIRQRNYLLYVLGIAHIVLFLIFIILFLLDSREITGINAWIKPMKFAASISIYMLTFGWVLHYLPNKKEIKFISIAISICMVMEMILIALQAARGVSSHFNVSTGFNAIVFSLMGNFIGINTLINLYTLVLFFIRKVELSKPMLHAWRAGLLLFFLGGISGGLMVTNMGHAVPGPDGGPGLPFVNWSTQFGDIRVAHFFTLHGLQVIPIISATSLKRIVPEQKLSLVIISFFALYALMCSFLHIQALSGIPLLNF